MDDDRAFWSVPAQDLIKQAESGPDGLTSDEARRRLAEHGPNSLRAPRSTGTVSVFLAQFKSPIVLILLFAAALALAVGDRTNPLIIMIIVLVSGLLGFWQEKGANDAVRKLLAIVQIKAAVRRDGRSQEIPIEAIVPGDAGLYRAGDVIAGDCTILESRDLFVDEAILTGETYPVEKTSGVLPAATPLAQRTNSLFMGTHAISGTARALVVRTGKDTEFGKVSESIRFRPPETEFEHGVRRFGYLLIEITLVLVIFIFAVNVYLQRPVLDSFLFAVALAVGLTPQLLPAITAINLAQGARRMAADKVIVKRLASIENFGSMNVLCSDKTGTLTEGVVRVHSTCDAAGAENDKVLFYAYLNAVFETGFLNPIDEAVRTFRKFDIAGYSKLDEVPYDFLRKRLSILVDKDGRHLMVTKGALDNVLQVCLSAEGAAGPVPLSDVRQAIGERFQELSGQGFRLLGVAYRNLGDRTAITKDDEKDMVFAGSLVLFDPPKAGLAETVRLLEQLGISLKIITGDNRLVTASVCAQVGLADARIVTGADLGRMSEEALVGRVNAVTAFAEVEPNQKERIIFALRKAGNVTGFIGDGINDASGLHAADVGISVDNAVDVAKEAADIVLLEKDLAVLASGVMAGRRTFANTLKYVYMAASANFGNMFSMAGASLFLPFLPLLPIQILLINLLTDLPEMTIATDAVDPELLERPRRWNVKSIRNFMLVFGPLSSVFDFLTFGVLLLVLHAGVGEFRAGWFVESVVSAAMVVLVIRTRRPFFRSPPGRYLLVATLAVAALAVIFPYTPLGQVFQFRGLPAPYLPVMAGIVLVYAVAAEITKRLFFRSRR